MSDPVEAPEAKPVEAATPQAAGFVPAIILQNRGVPITLYRLEGGALPALESDEAERETRKVHLRFTANHVAQIEDAFDGIQARVPIVESNRVHVDGKPLTGPDGPVTEDRIVGYEDRAFYGVQAFEQALQAKTMKTVRSVFAIAFDKPEEEMGEAMIPSEAMAYQTAVGVAWSIAQGVDPTDAAKILAQGLAAVEQGRAGLASRLATMMDRGEESTTDPPGPTG